MFVESFENFIDVITNAFTVKNLKKIVSFLSELPKLSFALIKGLFNKVSNIEIDPGALGYYLGFSIGFIASEVVTFFLTGGSGNIAKGIKTVFQSYKSLANTTGKAIRKTVTFTFDTFIKVVKKLLDFSKNIPKNIDALRRLILEFIRKLNKGVLIFSDEVLTLYNKLGVIIKKVPQQPVLASGIPVPIGDNIYALIREGKEVFRGSKKEVEKLAEKLKKLSKESSKKYFDEFLDAKNYENQLLKVANGEYIKKLLTSNIDIFDKFGKRIFRVSKKDFDTFIKFTKKTTKERKKIIEQVNKELRLRKAKYNPQTAKQKGYNVPLSKNGTSPDFEGTPYLYNDKSVVKIQIKGSRDLDFKESFEKIGITDRKKQKVILKNYTWHHLDDLDETLGCTMQLVLRKTHKATYKHFGSAGQSVFSIPLTKYLT
ncbi:hypothetical protein DS884_06760 [Tenacibaculum sp. E3R01]|nr:hypothetical protein DS884_06760 [Tenacibaculum sp. E3R01]